MSQKKGQNRKENTKIDKISLSLVSTKCIFKVEVFMKKKKAFSLVEIMIVIAIIGILSGMAVPSFKLARDRARLNKCHLNTTQLTHTAEVYNLNKGREPQQVTDLAEFMSGGKIPHCPSNGEYQWVAGTGADAETGLVVRCNIHACASSTFSFSSTQ
ncbi:MAG: prepilin-type N-terminal cleavage/methylation domain-containing protein [Candidatus Riflebacteria bacterium]|nr:prepilin-type N-terminal cleavage/methylation domain-containing protein [Candidatus Riflebacteria bacterium]